MLTEIWERLRGYDKWTETEATIHSAEPKNEVVGYARGTPIYGWRSHDDLTWIDQSGSEQRGRNLVVDEGSPLFQLYDGKTVKIRYNPVAPDEFYVHDELRYKVKNYAIAGGVGAIVIVPLALFLLVQLVGDLFRHSGVH